ncbi:MAG: radical SAM family heme chaperone HemW [Desulfuromonadales bacterium]|nr:radical SAM family heme chaperone HemW [Desulfuromonadales bacterium]
MVCDNTAAQSQQSGFGLYLHTPFCRSKCPYCDFFSIVPQGKQEVENYPALLRQELRQSAKAWDGPLTSIFFGGGTPSLLPIQGIEVILDSARASFGFADEIEISLEANPGTVSPRYLDQLRRAGVNRLSLGIQSLTDEGLGKLGRVHSRQDSLAAITAARNAGFDNLSLDLIYSRPDQDLDTLRGELAQLLELQPRHLSCYGLTIEEGTPFAQMEASGMLTLPDEEDAAAAYRCVHEELTKAGFAHYEISNFARPGYECRHNLGYWRRQPYLGVGAGAHSLSCNGWGERLSVPADLELYRQHLAAGEATAASLEICDQQLAMAETLYLGLRTAEGVSDAAFSRRFGRSVAEVFPTAIARCGERLKHEHGRWSFGLDGWLLYDHLIANFL